MMDLLVFCSFEITHLVNTFEKSQLHRTDDLLTLGTCYTKITVTIDELSEITAT